MRLSNNWLRLIGLMAFASITVLAACESDADRIRSINEAERTQAGPSVPTPTPTPLSATIDYVDIQDGDCIDSTIEQGVTIESVVIVPCSGSWQYRAVNSFTVENSNGYPGEDFFARVARERCDRSFTDFLYPLRESWEAFGGLLAHRVVNCLQQSFGLSASDPLKLDRLVSPDYLEVEECYNDVPETGGLQVELVGCSGDWEYRVLNSFAVADSLTYPGEDHFSTISLERCDRRFNYFFYPLRESWGLGDRTLICLQESFGLSATNPSKLDRLVSASRLDIGECYNEDPETGGLMVELVGCSGDWEYRVVSSFNVADSLRYPGEDHFSLLALEQCDRRFTYLLHPTRETWASGDRTVNCLQESFGLSDSDPSKLDRLVSVSRLNVGECYNETPETRGLLVELVGCSGDWELQVVDVFSVSHDDAFPGDIYFEDQAVSNCPTPWDYFYSPDSQSWRLGDREVICVKAP